MTGASLNAARRSADLERLAGGETVDVVVVGGGITGAGVALDAASRGLSVALLERRDLAHGTSRWSSKLVHGGLRYLEQGDVGLAWESAVERATLLRTVAPHLLRPLPYVTRRLGGMQRIAVAAGAEALAAGDGSVRTDASPAVLSAGIELIARGFVLASHGELEPGLDPWAELARAVDGYLRP